jgi:hypothetical protein
MRPGQRIRKAAHALVTNALSLPALFI